MARAQRKIEIVPLEIVAPELAAEAAGRFTHEADLLLVEDLAVAPENPRRLAPEESVEALADSIAASGLLMPLIAYRGADTADGVPTYQVTAGGRRLQALQRLAADGRWARGRPVPVLVEEQERAIAAGVTEQLSHVQISPADQVRTLTTPYFAALPDVEAARQLATSPVEVRKMRRILELPEGAREPMFAGRITVEQAIGLTYLQDMPAAFDKCLAQALEDPSLTGARMRQWMASPAKSWADTLWSGSTTIEAYRAAGGRTQVDLFRGEELVLDPAIVEQLGREAQRAEIEAKHPGRTIVEMGEHHYHNYNDNHHGLTGKAEADRYPPELLALLEVHWRPSPYRGGPTVHPHVMPTNRRALVEAGFLPKTAATAKDDGDELPQSLREAIGRVLTHVARLILIQDPDQVLEDWTQQLRQGPTYGRFAEHPQVSAEQLAGFSFIAPAAWDEAHAYIGHQGRSVRGEPRAKQRLALAACALLRLREPVFKDVPRIPVDDLYTYWRPDAAFWKRYKAPQLREVLVAQESDATAAAKKGELVDMLVALVEMGKRPLPPGFPKARTLDLDPTRKSDGAAAEAEPADEDPEDVDG